MVGYPKKVVGVQSYGVNCGTAVIYLIFQPKLALQPVTEIISLLIYVNVAACTAECNSCMYC